MKNEKKKKANRKLESVGEDHISELPDAVIIHVLSFLPSTKLCVKTSILSKRWQLLWTYVPNIIISQSYDSIRSKLVKRVVEKTLALHSSSKLNEFFIQISSSHELYPSIESWLLFAVGKAVKSLILEFNERHARYLLPQFLYSNSHIRVLNTTLCEFVPDGRISLSALKELTIVRATLNDEVIQNILSGTPVLECLQLAFCYKINSLDLSLKPNLKKLVIYVKEYDPECYGYYFDLKIVGPYVETLRICCSWEFFKFKLMNMSSLVKATLDFEAIDDEYEYIKKSPHMVEELVENVLPAKQLQLTNLCTQALSTLRMDVMASLLSNLKSFDVDCRGEEYLRGIESVLKCSHKLEKFVIFFDYGRSRKSKSDRYRKGYWTNAEIPSCLDTHLKTIEISGLIRTRVVIEYLQFLLKNSRILDKMIIRNSNHKYGMKLAEKWSSFPRSSQQAVFLVATKW
ncbi:F-box/LRR-repeat protein 25-like [Mercurialis annua]|uniref:F-box/LRR-repeat protein 25-like n=1 Tax=Mercurialis annua TaxID=3986 RepID=UPI00215EC865|nr:F-box/LRR-repeat protein 25-like [Mercurialis annua]